MLAMNWKRILCPVDLTQTCSECVRVASTLARECGAELVFLYVAVPELPASSGAAIPEVNQAIDRERQVLKQILPTATGVLHRHELVRGQPAQAIVHYAVQNQVDLIVMPTHGRTGFTRLLLGSVAEEVLRHAPCPVLAIRASAPQTEQVAEPQLAVT
jgi:universal stress protein A